MTSTRTATTATVLTPTLALAATCWLVAIWQMSGMNMGTATPLGSVPSFFTMWMPMMAAMMLPGAAPAVARRAHVSNRAGAAPLFVGSYLVVWALVGAAVYAMYRPHGSFVAGVVVIAAGLYELTPLKRHCRRRCGQNVDSGFEYGLYCLGSTIGLMLIMAALGIMSLAWMTVVTVLVLAQKLLPARTSTDVPLAFAILALGALILITPSSVPGLMPPP